MNLIKNQPLAYTHQRGPSFSQILDRNKKQSGSLGDFYAVVEQFHATLFLSYTYIFNLN